MLRTGATRSFAALGVDMHRLRETAVVVGFTNSDSAIRAHSTVFQDNLVLSEDQIGLVDLNLPASGAVNAANPRPVRQFAQVLSMENYVTSN